jgi:hypothetical protein
VAAASTNLKASASFDVRPVRSQVVLVALTVAAITALLVGGALLALDKSSGWAFVLISAGLFASVVWCWRQSHRDADLAQSHPTKVVLADGTNLSTDSRLLSSPDGVRNVAQVLEALALRQPLPEPSGMVGPGVVPIANSKQEAIDVVARINSDNQSVHDQAISMLRGQLSADSVAQVLDNATELPLGATCELRARNAPIEEVPQASSHGPDAP